MFSFSFFNLSCIFPKKSAALVDLSSSAPLLETNTVDISGNALLEKEAENLESKEPKEENLKPTESNEEILDKAADEEVALVFTSNIRDTYTYFTTLNDEKENQV